MITDKIKALFQFIEFLHSNIENFNQYNDLIKELETINNKRQILKPRNNFNDKLSYDKIQAEIKDKFKVIEKSIIQPIKAKARELNVCNFDNQPNYNFNEIESDIHQLKENFSEKDIQDILLYKKKYIEFRTLTNCAYFQDFFFQDLDEVLKQLFDFFKKTDKNEYKF